MVRLSSWLWSRTNLATAQTTSVGQSLIVDQRIQHGPKKREPASWFQEFPYARCYVAPTEFLLAANTFQSTVRIGCA